MRNIIGSISKADSPGMLAAQHLAAKVARRTGAIEGSLDGEREGSAKKMKILHVISTLAPHFGGPVHVVLGLARCQARLGHDVTICTTNANYPSGTLCVPKNRPVQDQGVSTWHFSVQATSLLISVPMARWMRKTIEDFDVIDIHGLYRFPQTYSAWCARKAGKPHLIRPHGALDPFLYQKSAYSVLIKRLYERLFDLPNLNGATAIHYTTHDEMERVGFLGLTTPAVVVPNAVDWNAFETLPPRGSFRARLDIAANIPLALFLGRVNFTKGLDLLVPAFAHVAREVREAVLVIVGPDNEGYGRNVRDWVREADLGQRVRFVGYLGPDEVKEAYVDAEVFVLPSYTENFGMTVIEAMACGCPVVISDHVNIWREVQEAGAGRVVGLDHRMLAEAIVSVLRNRDAAREMGAAGRAFVRRRFTWNRVVEELTVVYKAMVRGKVAELTKAATR